ncbi:MAG: SsrA-binding protein SmpB [Candidatus Sumerlaeota bacterium]|nr:SsrA-binding protein SmpB [Candidatus Sumerlaeota bacterium]
MPSKKKQESSDGRVIATNRRAWHDYFVERSIEVGIELRGTEVKSLREGKASLVDSFAVADKGEIWVHDIHIPPYTQGNRWNVDAKRPRRLLLHRAEINKLIGAASQSGYTLIPLRFYFNDRNRAKIELGLCRGKRAYDKRQAIKERDERREQQREMRDR